MIDTKLINGLKVVYNHDEGITIVTLSDNKIKELNTFLMQNPNAIVLISPTNYGGEYDLTFDVYDLDILKNIEGVKRVILSINRQLHSYTGLYYLKNLEYLQARNADSIDFDFSCFKKLEEVSFYWTAKTKGFFSCTSLKSIRIWKYKAKNKTLLEFPSLEKVIKLGIIQSNITSIRGLEKLKHLKVLELSYNLGLEINYADLCFTMPYVEELEINTCKKVGLDFIKIFPNVRKLTLVKLQDIEELRPILDGLPKLEELFVGETKILEIDNSYYLNYPKIKKFFFDERKYHKIKNKNLRSD